MLEFVSLKVFRRVTTVIRFLLQRILGGKKTNPKSPMASAELDQKNTIADLTNKGGFVWIFGVMMDEWHPLLPTAIREYEGLQRRHEATTKECKILEEERDEAIKKLREFQQVSTMVIEEINAIQEKLEIERTCRESAEALASKLNHQKHSLKRKSMMLLSQLGPGTISQINLEDEDEELQSQLQLTLREKNHLCDNLAMLKEQLEESRQELLQEKHANSVLMAETVQQKKLLRKYNRVSRFAVEEYQALQDTLNLERDLREGAENFARAMVVEQKMLKRHSQILMQSTTPSHALQEALSQVTSLTKDLESLKHEHQSQIKKVEAKLSRCEALKELTALKCKLELVEEEKKEYSDECSKAQAEVKDLRSTVDELQKKLQTATDPAPLPVPVCPPPPPPPLPTLAAFNPLSSLLSLIRKRQNSSDIPLGLHNCAQRAEVDVRQQAVEEMMNRIKNGVQLRPVSQRANNRRKMERKPSHSAFQELRAIMGNCDRSVPPHPKMGSSPSPNDELQKVLLRRRDVLEVAKTEFPPPVH
ncbi:shootin-1 isoform X3 [Syngnathus acus]|uniref:shootin-1 isoform X3 n=1 Tax=Syngnathus acus TaxID=161584 RepID=UPI001886105E|nr:shootin-1 isoform X3 [Syngnathus acus]